MDAITRGNWKAFFGKGLSDQETQCALLATDGMTNKEIARERGIAPDTVKKRLQSAMYRLGVDRRAALVSEAIRRGIIAPACVAFLAVLLGLQHQQPTTVRRPSAPRRVEVRIVARQEVAAWAA